MVVKCSSCGTQLKINDERIAEGGTKFRCPKCKNPFTLKKNDKNISAEEKKVTNTDSDPSVPPDSTEDSTDVECNCPKGAPTWIVTFADLSTLMLTFFVLLLSFANTDIVKFKEMLGSVQDAFGVQKKTHGEYQPAMNENNLSKPEPITKGISLYESRAARDEMEKMEIAGKIKKTIEDINQSKNIQVKVGKDGVRVRVKGGYFFETGSADLKKISLPFLEKIAGLMKDIPFKLKVEGHTDNVPISTREFPSNWELSAVRATTVLRYFIEDKKIEKKRLTAIGFADNKPIADNTTSEGRAKNRRVEFIFIKQ